MHTKSKKHDNFESDWLEQEQDNLQRFFWMFWNLLKEIILKNNNQLNSNVTTRTWVLSTEWTTTWANTVLLSKWKNNGGLRLLEWSMSFFRNHINKDEGNEIQCKCNYFWSIQRKADHPQVVQEFELSHHMSVVITKSIVKCLLENKTGVRCAKTPNATV